MCFWLGGTCPREDEAGIEHINISACTPEVASQNSEKCFLRNSRAVEYESDLLLPPYT